MDVAEDLIGVPYMKLWPQFVLPSYRPVFFCWIEGCQQSFHALHLMNTLTTVPVHKTGLNVDDDHDDIAMTESLFL